MNQSTVAPTTIDFVALFDMLRAIENDANVDKTFKVDAKTFKLKTFDQIESLTQNLLEKIDSSDLCQMLKYYVYHLKFDKIKMILDSGRLKDFSGTETVVNELPGTLYKSSDENISAVLKLLIDNGLDVTNDDYREFQYNLRADRPKTIEIFLSVIDVNIVFADGHTPITRNYKSGKWEVTKVLIKHGAQITDAMFKDIIVPEDVQQLIDERKRPKTVITQDVVQASLPTVATNQPERLAALKVAVAKMIADMSFPGYEIVLNDMYHVPMQKYCKEFNEANQMFVASFNTTTYMFKIEFA